MNHPNATPADLTRAARIIQTAATRAGFDHATAEDMAQNATVRILYRPWKTMPENVIHAAHVIRRQAMRYGWQSLLNPSDRPRGRSSDRTEQAVIGATMAIVRRRSAMLTPAAAAEYAETRGLPLAKVIAAQGVGITDPDDDQKTSPAVLPGSARRIRRRPRGVPGLHTSTDPVPGSHARAALAVALHHACYAEGHHAALASIARAARAVARHHAEAVSR